MSLLRDIQAAAVDPNTDVATLLRKCKILAVRLGNEKFKKWVDHELNGYNNTEDLPEYRILHTESYGHFSGTFGSGLNNAPIPPSCLPKELRDRVTKSYLTAPISAFASLINTEDRSNAREQWPADMVAYFGQKIYQGMNCLSAWKVLPYNVLVALVDTIKTRVLNFALEIEGEAPDAGEAPPNAPPLPQEKVSQVFNTYISGNVQNVATGSSHVTQSGDIIVMPGNFDSLRKHLASLGVEEPDITDLDNAIKKDTKAQGKPALGKRVQSWIGKMVGKAASGAWKVSTSVAGTVLGKALSKYFGLE
jgi:hypothetical protein